MSSTRRFKGEVAIVTGGAGSLGSACATRLASEGATVVVMDVDHTGASSVLDRCERYGTGGMVVCADVSDEAAVSAALHAVHTRFGRIDVLVNNAAAFEAQAIGCDTTIAGMDVAAWDRTFAVNVRGAMLMCKHVLPRMIEAGGGSIVNMGSRSSLMGDGSRAAYGCSKAALNSLTRYVATMYGSDNVRCNTVVPGSIENTRFRDSEPSSYAARRAAERLLPEAPTPDSVATLVSMLSVSEGLCITGQMFVVDSGVSVHRPIHAIERFEEISTHQPVTER